MSENCDKSGNNSGNLGVGPGVPNPNEEPVLRPEQNMPERVSQKEQDPFISPAERQAKRYRPLGSFAHSTGKDEVEPGLPVTKSFKEQDVLVQPQESSSKTDLKIGDTSTRPNKTNNMIEIGTNSVAKELQGIATPESTQKDLQSVDMSTRPEIKVGDTIIPASDRQAKQATLEINTTPEAKTDLSVAETDNRQAKEDVATDPENYDRFIKDDVTVGATEPVESAKIDNEKTIDATNALLSPKQYDDLGVGDDKTSKTEEDLTPDTDATSKTEEEIASTTSTEKGEVDIDDADDGEEKSEVEIDDTTPGEKGEQEIADADDGEEKSEVEIDDTTATEKGEVEVDDAAEGEEKSEEEIDDTTATEKGEVEISDDSDRTPKPNNNEIEITADSVLNKEIATSVEDIENSEKTPYTYDIDTPADGQIIENNYSTAESLRNKDVADNEKAQNYDGDTDAGKNVLFTDDEGAINGDDNLDVVRKLKDSGSITSAEASAGFMSGTSDGTINEALTDSKAKEYSDDALSEDHRPDNNANANYKYYDKNDDFDALTSATDFNAEVESNIGNFDSLTSRKDISESAPSNIGNIASDPDQYSERFDYDSTLEGQDGRVLRGTGEGIGADTFVQGTYTSNDELTHKELYPNDTVSLSSSANSVDNDEAGINNDNFIYDEFTSDRNADVSYDGGEFEATITPRKETTESKSFIDTESSDSQYQDRFNYADTEDGGEHDGVIGTRDEDDDRSGVKNSTTQIVSQVGEERPENQGEYNFGYGDDSEDYIKNDRFNKLDSRDGEDIIPDNYVKETSGFDKTQDTHGIENIVANNETISSAENMSSQETSNTNYDEDVERRFKKSAGVAGDDNTTIDSESATHYEGDDVVYNTDYSQQVNVQGASYTEQPNSNIEFSIDDIDKQELKIDATNNVGSSDAPEYEGIKFAEVEVKNSDDTAVDSSIVIPGDDAISLINQETTNFDFTDITKSSIGKPSAVKEVESASEGREPEESKEVFSTAAATLDVIDNAETEQLLREEFGDTAVDSWKTDGVYSKNAREQINADPNKYVGITPRVQESTNFSYGDYSNRDNKLDATVSIRDTDSNEVVSNIDHSYYNEVELAEYNNITVDNITDRLSNINAVGEEALIGQEHLNFNYNDVLTDYTREGQIAQKNNLFSTAPIKGTSWLDDILGPTTVDGKKFTSFVAETNEVTGDYLDLLGENYGKSDYVLPLHNVKMLDDNGNLTTRQDNGLPDTSDISYGNASKGFVGGAVANLTGAVGLDNTLNTVLTTMGTIADVVQDFGELESGITVNNLLVGSGRRLGSAEAAMVLSNLKSNATIEGGSGISGVASFIDTIDDSIGAVGNLINHPVAFITNKLREIDNDGLPSGVMNASNVVLQGTRGNRKNDKLFDFTGEDYTIEASHAAQFSSMAHFRNSVIDNGSDGKFKVNGLKDYDENERPKTGMDGEEAVTVPDGAEWKDYSETLGLSTSSTTLNKWVGDDAIAVSYVPPTEYSAFLGTEDENGQKMADVWNINKPRTTEIRNQALNAKPFSSNDYDSDWIGISETKDLRRDIFWSKTNGYWGESDGSTVEVNGITAPQPTNIAVAASGEVHSLFKSDSEKGWSGSSLFSLTEEETYRNNEYSSINKSPSEWSQDDNNLGQFYSNIHASNSYDGTYDNEGKLSSENKYGGKVGYKNILDDKAATGQYIDPHILEVTTTSSRFNTEGKDAFLKYLVSKDSENDKTHFSFSQSVDSEDEGNIFNSLLSNITPTDVTNEQRGILSSIVRDDDINSLYDGLMFNNNNIQIGNNYEQSLVSNDHRGDKQLIDPHMSQFEVNYSDGGDEIAIYDKQNSPMGKDLFTQAVFDSNGQGAYNWFGSEKDDPNATLDAGGEGEGGFNMMYYLHDEKTLSDVYYDENKPKNSLSVVNFKYKAKLSGTPSSRYPAYESEDFNSYRFKTDDEDYDKMFNSSNYAVSSLAANVPTLIEYDKFTAAADDTGRKGENTPPNAPNAASMSPSGVTSIKGSSDNFKTFTMSTEENESLKHKEIDIVPEDRLKFEETDIGLVRTGGEVDFYTTTNRGDSDRKPTKQEIKPQFYTDREVITYKQEIVTGSDGTETSIKTGIIENTTLQGATLGFQATEDTSDDDARFKSYDIADPSNTTDTMLGYRETENIKVEKKSQFYSKIANKFDAFATDRVAEIKNKYKSAEKGCGFLTIINNPAKEITSGSGGNIVYQIPMQFNPDITGESRSSNWSSHTAIGRTNDHLIWANTSSRTIQFKTTYAIISPGKNAKEWFTDNGALNEAYDGNDWAGYWTEENLVTILGLYRGLLLPKGYSNESIDSTRLDGNRLSPPVITIFFGDNSDTRWSQTEGLAYEFGKSRWIATDLNLDPRLEAGYTNDRNPRMYDITMTMKEVAPSWRSYQSHQELGLPDYSE